MPMPMPMPMLYAVMQSLQPCSHDSHRDFSAPAAYPATAAMEMSQPRLCSMRMQPCSHSSHRDLSAFAAYTATAAMEISQLCPSPYPCPCLCSMQPCSHCSHAAMTAIEISQPPQLTQPLQQWRYLSHTHAHVYTPAHRHAAARILVVT